MFPFKLFFPWLFLTGPTRHDGPEDTSPPGVEPETETVEAGPPMPDPVPPARKAQEKKARAGKPRPGEQSGGTAPEEKTLPAKDLPHASDRLPVEEEAGPGGHAETDPAEADERRNPQNLPEAETAGGAAGGIAVGAMDEHDPARDAEDETSAGETARGTDADSLDDAREVEEDDSGSPAHVFHGQKVKLWGFGTAGPEAEMIAFLGGKVMVNIGKTTTMVVTDRPIDATMKKDRIWSRIQELRDQGQKITVVEWSRVRPS